MYSIMQYIVCSAALRLHLHLHLHLHLYLLLCGRNNSDLHLHLHLHLRIGIFFLTTISASVPSHRSLPHWHAARPPWQENSILWLGADALAEPGTPKMYPDDDATSCALFLGVRTRHSDACSPLLSKQPDIMANVINCDQS